MAEAVQAKIGAGIRVIGPEALHTIGNCVATDIRRRDDVGRTGVVAGVAVIAVGLRCRAKNRPADQCACDAKANACAATIAAAPAAAILYGLYRWPHRALQH